MWTYTLHSIHGTHITAMTTWTYTVNMDIHRIHVYTSMDIYQYTYMDIYSLHRDI